MGAWFGLGHDGEWGNGGMACSLLGIGGGYKEESGDMGGLVGRGGMGRLDMMGLVLWLVCRFGCREDHRRDACATGFYGSGWRC